MKIRLGFVSNSSSSSFVAIVSKQAFDQALELITDNRYVKILKKIAVKEKVFDREAYIIQEQVDTGGYSSVFRDGDCEPKEIGLTRKDFDKLGEDGEEFLPNDAVYKYENMLEELMKNKPEMKNEICIVSDSIG